MKIFMRLVITEPRSLATKIVDQKQKIEIWIAVNPG